MMPLAILASGALLTGCGNHVAEEAEDAGFNQADVAFATEMMPHHEQAVEMADLVPDRSDSQELIELAEEIRQGQEPEIEALTTMLERWGESVPVSGDGHTDHEMSGMMSEEDMAMLERSDGAEFDRMWMEIMVEHHEGAIDMANAQLAEGTSPEASELAEDIIEVQEAEIDTMREMLGRR
ncbi:DUF305 domain-containing protein [Haloechinothrix sp. YIM 98757]|uniref:DUF305 domain-containing protein n=2 Tax=Haloechinothrix aidingensis TaxID=2752311 RepID=A0A838ACB4_9PSEU|nr:DUF305 domain-containing protein [Haloechinothrix aidingensis]MBA0126867.1 DUF305 domain-containing protein [Haloechinothrix aidingensis]